MRVEGIIYRIEAMSNEMRGKREKKNEAEDENRGEDVPERTSRRAGRTVQYRWKVTRYSKLAVEAQLYFRLRCNKPMTRGSPSFFFSQIAAARGSIPRKLSVVAMVARYDMTTCYLNFEWPAVYAHSREAFGNIFVDGTRPLTFHFVDHRAYRPSTRVDFMISQSKTHRHNKFLVKFVRN
jgi:hypothetical protein